MTSLTWTIYLLLCSLVLVSKLRKWPVSLFHNKIVIKFQLHFAKSNGFYPDINWITWISFSVPNFLVNLQCAKSKLNRYFPSKCSIFWFWKGPAVYLRHYIWPEWLLLIEFFPQKQNIAYLRNLTHTIFTSWKQYTE